MQNCWSSCHLTRSSATAESTARPSGIAAVHSLTKNTKFRCICNHLQYCHRG